jgi:hypothetical protein
VEVPVVARGCVRSSLTLSAVTASLWQVNSEQRAEPKQEAGQRGGRRRQIVEPAATMIRSGSPEFTPQVGKFFTWTYNLSQKQWVVA